MRSSKSRSRSKANRPRTLGNIINRVFDSSGPEGKVRGTPQQIIEKYQFLARDAQLSNDRVAAENFNQHAEHYMRMLAEAQREMAAEQEARQGQYGNNGGGNGNGGQPYQNNGGNGQNGGNQNGGNQQRDRGPREDREYRDFRSDRADRQDRGERPDRADRQDRDVPREDRAPMAIDVVEPDDDLGLVETPEHDVQPQPRQDRPPADRVAENAPVKREKAISPMMPDLGLAQAAEENADTGKADRSPRRPRGPRKPKADTAPDAAE
jgi:hypothetical protein